MIKLQVVDLIKYLNLKNIKLSFRSHPRDPYDWSTYLNNYDVNILNKNEDLEKQIKKYYSWNGFFRNNNKMGL